MLSELLCPKYKGTFVWSMTMINEPQLQVSRNWIFCNKKTWLFMSFLVGWRFKEYRCDLDMPLNQFGSLEITYTVLFMCFVQIQNVKVKNT